MGNQSERDETDPQREKSGSPGGVFVTKGSKASIGFPDGFILRLDEEGSFEGGRVELLVGLDMCPYWLEVAYGHIKSAKSSHNNLLKASADEDDERLGFALEEGFIAAMQAVVSAATAVEALCAAVHEYIQMPKVQRKAWDKNRTARYKRIVETLRYGFQVGASNDRVSVILKEIFRFRNWAVHPPFGITSPKPHPDIGRHTEWRFVAFRYENAQKAVGFALSLIVQLARKPEIRFPDLVKYCDELDKKVSPLVEKWESEIGQLLPKDNAE